jgi:hypothetical protein
MWMGKKNVKAVRIFTSRFSRLGIILFTIRSRHNISRVGSWGNFSVIKKLLPAIAVGCGAKVWDYG